MNKLLTSILFCITILVLSYTNVKVYAATEESVAGISTVLDRVDPIEVKSAFNNVNWTTVRVNLRKEASMNSDIIVTLDKKVKVELMKTSSGWAKVKYNESFGYVKAEYLTDKELFTSDINRWGIELTDDEIDLLAKIIWTEARGEIDRGKWAATEIIMNRIYSKTYPDDLYSVLSQEGQFTSWKIRNDADPKEDIYECIEEVLRNETNELTMDYLYFSTSPRNNNGTIKIGNHYFCREDN